MKKLTLMILAVVMSAVALAAQCAATTKKGTQCKRQAAAGSSYCWQHGGKTTTQRAPSSTMAPTAKHNQCNAITKGGARCKLDASAGPEYCWQHQGQVAETNLSTKVSGTTAKNDVAARTTTPVSIGGTCTAITKAGKRCTRKAASGSDKCWQHAR